ncbi:osiris 18 [Nesidiocoris tenuis]|uniref:Osiris 18 n=1 Tax=Nesidiocoris tenuis TaxID=355587 RepID=A0ABN7AWA1_9HEMI|nr:osiris 18 [Nesidiocoris tenuis]
MGGRWCGYIVVVAFAIFQASNGLEVVDCLLAGKDGCLEGHLSQALSRAEALPTLRITRHLEIISNPEVTEEVNSNGHAATTLEKLERYLYGHSLSLKLPEELISGARGLVSDEMLDNVPKTLVLPLAQSDQNQGRGFIKKVVMPFILGLKFKATAVIPIAIALIALKTWKALTLGLLSLVLTAAMVIFRLTKPKILNYEVYYPSHHHHDEHYHGRGLNDLPYRGHQDTQS